jgi:hypothetical protein
MRARATILAAVLAALAAAPAEARTRCGAETFRIDDTIQTYRGNFLAVCDSKRACKSLTYVADKAQPNQWSHRLAFLRKDKDAPWILQLTSAAQQADPSEGFSFAVDGNEPLQAPPEVLSSPGSLNDYELNADLGQIVINAFGPGANVEWRYTAKEPRGPQSAWFSLKGLKSSLRWIDCMQKK